MKSRGNIFIGLILIVLGLLFFMKNILNFDFNIGSLIAIFWPSLFLILPGLIFHSKFFASSNRDAGVLVPGGILLFSGLTCQISMMFDIWYYMWPGFIVSVAIGLFELYMFGNRDAGLLVPVGILAGTGVTCQVSVFFNAWDIMWPGFILSVAIGLFALYLFGNREKGLLIPVAILAGVSIVFFSTFSLRLLFSFQSRQLFISVVLILVGILVIFKNSFHRKNY